MIMIKNIIPATTKRVSQSTNPDVNTSIRDKTIQCLNLYKDCNKDLLSDKIKKLDYEWDTERCLETNASLLILISSILGVKSNRCWFIITGIVGAFLLQHSLMGWCPPVPVIRKAGVRTSEEINNEKIVLKIFRGDFQESNLDATEMLLRAEK